MKGINGNKVLWCGNTNCSHLSKWLCTRQSKLKMQTLHHIEMINDNCEWLMNVAECSFHSAPSIKLWAILRRAKRHNIFSERLQPCVTQFGWWFFTVIGTIIAFDLENWIGKYFAFDKFVLDTHIILSHNYQSTFIDLKVSFVLCPVLSCKCR